MHLQKYLRRIGISVKPAPTLDTLGNVLRAHNHHIPFENLDVQLEIPLTTSVEEACEKIVNGHRGGWCYEQNGVLGWALSEIGFDVRRIAASVMREERGPDSHANHLTLVVRLPDNNTRWLADVGFGGSLLHPIPLLEGAVHHSPFDLGLRQLEDGYWQFWENLGEADFSFDFEDVPANERALSDRCHYLQTNEESGFVKNFVCQIRRADSHLALRGRMLTESTNEGKSGRILETAGEFVTVLKNEFNLNVPEAAGLWGQICERHEQFITQT